MKLPPAIVFSVVAASTLSTLAIPLADHREHDGPNSYSYWGAENKRTEVVERREEGAISYPTWNKEDKRTVGALWTGTSWALEEKRGLKRSDGGSLLLKPCGWGVEDKRRAGDCPPRLASDE
ncbi:hypothetical protein GGF50DRAFT_116651 [Schizophyllum commune]